MKNSSSENKCDMKFKQYTINVQYILKHPKKKLKGKICMMAKGGLSESSPLRSDSYWDSHAGRLDHWSSGQEYSKTKLSSRGAIRLKSIQIRWSF